MGNPGISRRRRSLVVGCVCGLLCALCVGVYVTEVDRNAAARQSEILAEYGGEQIDVCVAKRDIVAGETITEGDVETRTWVATLLPANAVVDRRDAVGKQVGSTILSGEVVTTGRFGFDTEALEIPDGLVAVSVPSRDVQAVGGSLSAGSVVDIYAIGANSTSRLASSTKVLATSLESGQAGVGTSAWVTVAVAPSKVQELVSAAQNLELYFTIPSPSGTDEDRSGDSDGGIDRSDAKSDSKAKISERSGNA